MHHRNLSMRFVLFSYTLQEVGRWENNADDGEHLWRDDEEFRDLAGF